MGNNKVTVLCITYNQEKFIKQALDGFVMQKTNFDFEVIVGEDCSTDHTAEIVKEYADKYPDIIKPHIRKKNLGIEDNFFEIASIPKSGYVALCEGDDYWTDPDKLQIQVDFLDTHPECSVCFHPVRIVYEDVTKPDELFPSAQMLFNKNILTLEYLLIHNFIQTNSVMYRWRFNNSERIQDVFPRGIIPGDYFLHLLHAQKGKIGFINEIMSVYRRHKDGIWRDSEANMDAIHLKYGVKELKFYLELEKAFPEYHALNGHFSTIRTAMKFFQIYLKHQKFEEMNEIIKLCPECLSIKAISGIK